MRTHEPYLYLSVHDRADCPRELTVLTLPEAVIVETGLLGTIVGMEK